MGVYQYLFWIPTIASLWLLLRMRGEGSLYGRSFALFLGWFVLAALALFRAPHPAVFVLGFAAQTTLALVLEAQAEGGVVDLSLTPALKPVDICARSTGFAGEIRPWRMSAVKILSRSRLVRSLFLGTTLLGLLFTAAPAQAAAAAAYFHASPDPLTNPPIGGRVCTYKVTVPCQCGFTTSCSEESVLDALNFAAFACYEFCKPKDRDEPSLTGIFNQTGSLDEPAGFLHAAGPGIFEAYAPGSPDAIGESSDFFGLAELLAETTGSSTCWLSGPLEFFGTPAEPGGGPVVVVP